MFCFFLLLNSIGLYRYATTGLSFTFCWVFGLFLDWGFMKQHSCISLFL